MVKHEIIGQMSDRWIFMKIGRLGGRGTDFAAFVQHVGVPSVDLFFGGGILISFDAKVLLCYYFLCTYWVF